MEPLTYRSPQDEARVNHTLTCIRQREAGFWIRIAAKFALGIPLSFLGPLVVGMFFAALFEHFWIHIGLQPLFWISALIMIPILYITEMRTRGDFLIDEMRAQGGSASDFATSSRGEWELRRSAAAAAGAMEIFLLAPRLTLEAINSIRTRIKLTDASLRRAAQIIFTLQSHPGATEVSDLRHAEESPGDLQTILRYLRMHDWIDISADAQRTWLLSRARLRLARN